MKAMQFMVVHMGKVVEQGTIHSEQVVAKIMMCLALEQSILFSPLKFTPDKPRTKR